MADPEERLLLVSGAGMGEPGDAGIPSPGLLDQVQRRRGQWNMKLRYVLILTIYKCNTE